MLQFNGFGVLQRASGETYEGQFCCGLREGGERIDEETLVNKLSPNFPNPFGCDDNPT